MVRQQKPFLPLIASPSVQAPFHCSEDGTAKLQTSYDAQFPNYCSAGPSSSGGPFSENHSLRHYATLREKCKLTRVEDPKHHYCSTTSASITSPDRLDALKSTKRPELCPTEFRGRIITSPFDFETTNSAMMRPAAREALVEASVRRLERRQHRATAASPVAHDVADDVSSQKRHKLRQAPTPLEERLFDALPSATAASVQQTVEACVQSSLGAMQAAGRHPKEAPYQYRDEFPVIRRRFQPDIAKTTTQRAGEAVLEFWRTKDPEVRRGMGGRQPVVDRDALPSISLAYKDRRLPEDDEIPLCRSCAGRQTKFASRCDEARSSSQMASSTSHFQTTYREYMKGAQSSLS